jgi:hypothetical protein
MAQYRKKPVVIEAMQLTEENKNQVFNWITCTKEPTCNAKGSSIKIQTLEGDMEASIGDYIIKGVKGEYYPCKPDIFEMTYDNIDENPLPCTKCGSRFCFMLWL